MTFRRLLASFFLIVILAAAGGVAAYLYSSEQDKTYETSAELLFGATRPELGVLGGSFEPEAPDERESASAPVVVESPATVRAVAKATGLTADTVSDQISIVQVRGTNVVSVVAESPTPQQARRLANEYARTFRRIRASIDQRRARAARRALEGRLRRLSRPRSRSIEGVQLREQIIQLVALERLGTGNPELIESAGLPTEPTGPQTARNTLFGILFGGVLGLALSALLLRPRIAE